MGEVKNTPSTPEEHAQEAFVCLQGFVEQKLLQGDWSTPLTSKVLVENLREYIEEAKNAGASVSDLEKEFSKIAPAAFLGEAKNLLDYVEQNLETLNKNIFVRDGFLREAVTAIKEAKGLGANVIELETRVVGIKKKLEDTGKRIKYAIGM
ncbi:hypothetical protein HZA39_04030 [Candidatus Peregrinibacteria bacterium]|nr:hypothetical protein [Candidatus Peregrinibacteria bacterium]